MSRINRRLFSASLAVSGLSWLQLKQLADAEVDCVIEELYVGYPGYRALITGVAGPGEGACLAELEKTFQGFNASEQNQANL